MERHAKKEKRVTKSYLGRLDAMRKGIFIKVKSFASRYGINKESKESLRVNEGDVKHIRKARRRIASGKLRIHSEEDLRKALEK